MKSIVFVTVAMFVMYLPLGDPGSFKCSGHPTRYSAICCCIGEIYKMIVRGMWKIGNALEFFTFALCDVLYDAKLKFYRFLEKVDGRDLCRSVCCEGSVVEAGDRPNDLGLKGYRSHVDASKRNVTSQDRNDNRKQLKRKERQRPGITTRR